MKETPFDHVPCTRCDGSGHHSFNLRSGTVCFKCKGTGYTLTKRGLAAAKMYLDSLRKPLSEVKVGDVVRLLVDYVNATPVQKWCEVTEIAPDGIASKETKLQAPPTHKVRAKWTKEEKEAKQRAALDYQATLTAKGEVRKR